MSVAQRFQPRVPDGFDVTRPNDARIYDYLLYGKDNFAADRAVAEQVAAAGVEPRRLAEANRAFVCRAIRTVARRGVSQFLDLGSGLPAFPGVHEVAREVTCRARVAYVDHDPVVVAHNNALLAAPDAVVAVHGDLRDPEWAVEQVSQTGCIDFGQPVAVLLTAVLHLISDDEDPLMDAAASAYQPTRMPFRLRTRTRITRFFDGFDLLAPGVVCLTGWRPDTCTDRTPLRAPAVCGVGQLRK